jgi:hypothetical protein
MSTLSTSKESTYRIRKEAHVQKKNGIKYKQGIIQKVDTGRTRGRIELTTNKKNATLHRFPVSHF